jgi:hypothetical protein
MATRCRNQFLEQTFVMHCTCGAREKVRSAIAGKEYGKERGKWYREQ